MNGTIAFQRPELARWGPTILRLIVGVVFVAHGWQKLTAFGVDGLAGFLGSIGIPLAGLAAPLLIAVELLGGVALILGLFTRPIGTALAAVMLVAMVSVHLPNGFYISPEGVGIEFTLTLFAASVSLALLGPGAAALEGILAPGGSLAASTTVTPE